MKTLWAWWARVSGLFSRNRREREMADEFSSHFEIHVADNIRAGMNPDEARREAMLKFGSVEAARESVRETARPLWIETTFQDVLTN